MLHFLMMVCMGQRHGPVLLRRIHRSPLELRPLSCTGLGADLNDPTNIGLNDVLGGYSLTLIDSLDMFAVLDDETQFKKYLDKTRKYCSFNVSSTVQVFETTIRAMGGLLSAHLYASAPHLGQSIDGYDGHLLELAYDLGERLLPAFDTSSGIPHPRVNLQHGIVPLGSLGYITETCSSGAGSLVLEFGLLSRLTGDSRFDDAARKAFFAIFDRRTELDLIAMAIDSTTGLWQSPITGNGASIDSYYEYALKYYILFDDDSFLKVFETLYESLKNLSFEGWLFRNIHFQKGVIATGWIDALAAFFPTLQVLYGDISGAIRNHLVFFKLWNTYFGIPERWNGLYGDSIKAIELEWYPLRPEFIESNYYLYQATKDPFYLQVGLQVMKDIETNNRVPCGYAGYQDIRTGELADRMESFFLSETAKYLYLLFDPDHFLNNQDSNFVFSTEAHPFWYDEKVIKYSHADSFPKVQTRIKGSLGKALFSSSSSSSSLSSSSSSSSSTTSTSYSIKRVITKAVRWTARKLIQELSLYFTIPVADYPPLIQSNETTHSSIEQGPSTCPVWLPHSDFYSRVLSWDNFYELDRMYNYTSPSRDQPEITIKRREQAIEFCNDFYKDFAHPQATCVIPKSTPYVDVLFAIPNGESRGQMSVERGNSIQTNNLNGMRMRLGKYVDSKGETIYRVLMLNGVKVDGHIWVEDLHLDNDGKGLMDLMEGIVRIEGTKIVNLHVS